MRHLRWILLASALSLSLSVATRNSLAGVSPTFVSYSAPGEITLNAPFDAISSSYSVDYLAAPPTYQFSDSAHPVTAGAGCTNVDADTVDCPLTGNVSITANMAAGSDTLFWFSAAGGDTFAVNGGDGVDQVFAINIGGLAFNGGEGFDTLNVHDPFFADGTEGIPPEVGYALYPGEVKRSGLADIDFDSSTEDVNIETDQHALNYVNVHGTASQTDTFVSLNGPDNEFLLAPGLADLDAVQGLLQVTASGDDIAVIQDLAEGATAYSISGGTIDRSDPFAGLTYSGFGLVSLYGSNAGAVFDVTGSSVALALHGGPGPDNVQIGDNLDNVQGTVTVFPGGGSDTLSIDDSGSTGSHTYTINENPVQLARNGSAGVSWDNSSMEAVHIFATAEPDAFNVNAWHPAMELHGNGGGDLFVVKGDGRKGSNTASIHGGSDADTLLVDNSAAIVPASYDLINDSLSIGCCTLADWSGIEAFAALGGSSNETFNVTSTSPTTAYTLNGNGSSDTFFVASDLSAINGPVTVTGGAGTDTVQVNDSSGPPGGSYDIRGTRLQRMGSAPVFAGVDTAQLITSSGDDVIRLLGTVSSLSLQVFAGLGNDEARVFAAGLAATGIATLDSQSGIDEQIRLYTGGLTSSFSGTTLIVTTGRHDVAHNFDLRTVASTNADSDGDGCIDSLEIGPDENTGGLRDPSDAYDFFDVVGPMGPPERAIDLADALAVLNKFGSLPGDGNYDVLFDRVAGPALQPWRSQQATGMDLGIDLSDALVNLLQFGHSCFPP